MRRISREQLDRMEKEINEVMELMEHFEWDNHMTVQEQYDYAEDLANQDRDTLLSTIICLETDVKRWKDYHERLEKRYIELLEETGRISKSA